MSYRKTQSKTLNDSRNILYNPETVYTHMKRMQNLLDEYDEENSFLNKQVLSLLDQKRQTQNKYVASKDRETLKNKKQYASGRNQNQRRTNSNYASKQFSAKKKKYEYIDEDDRSFSPPHGVLERSKIGSRENSSKMFFADTPYERVNNKNQQARRYLKQEIVSQNKIKQFVDKPQPKQSSYVSASQSRDKKQSPQVTSRFIAHVDKQQYQYTLGKSNLIPILKKDPYIRSPDQNKQINNSSPQRRSASPNLSDSKVSNRSKKSGINVVSSTIIKPQQNLNNKVNQNEKTKELQQSNIQITQKSPQKSQKRVSFSDEIPSIKMTQSTLRQQGQNKKIKPQSTQNKQTKNQRLSRQHLYSMNVSVMIEDRNKEINKMAVNSQLKRNNSEAIQTGINTEPIYNEMSLVRNRSMSQHRITPSQKIIYQQNLKRKESNPNLRVPSKQREPKKKFINIVSHAMLAQKLGQAQKANNVYK